MPTHPIAASNPRRLVALLVLALVAALLPDVTADAADPAYVAAVRDYDATDGIANETTVYLPTGTAPPAGWPVLLFGHGLGGTKADVAVEAAGAAGQGYLAVATSVPNGEDQLVDRPVHLSRILDGLLAEYAAIVDAAHIGASGASGGAIGALLFFNTRSLDSRIATVAGSLGFPLDHPSQIETAYDWSLAKPLSLVNHWRDPLIPYDLTRPAWRRAAGPRFLLTRFVEGHGEIAGTSAMSTASAAFSRHYLQGDAAALDTLVHAYDGLSYGDGVFEYHLPGYPDVVVDPVAPTPHIAAGGTVAHTFRVTNQGTVTSPAGTLRITRQTSLVPTSASGGCTIGTSDVDCAVPALAAGAQVDLAVTSIAGAGVTNDVARIVARLDLPGMRAAAFGETAIGTAVSPFPDLGVVLEANRDTTDATNPPIVYTATVTNRGGKAAKNGRLVLSVDPSLTPLDPTCVWRQASGTANCKLPADFAPGATRKQSFRFARTTPPGSTTALSVAGARVVNGYMDEVPSDNVTTALVNGNPGVPDVADVFVSSTLPVVDAVVGSTTTVETTFGNRGTATARGVVVKRRIPIGVTVESVPAPCSVGPAPGVPGATDLTCNLPDLPPLTTSQPNALSLRVTTAIAACQLPSSVTITTTTSQDAGTLGDDTATTTSLVDGGACFRQVSGTVTSGGVVPPANTAGAGACPVGSFLPAPDCVGFRIAVADAAGRYGLPLLKGVDYRVGGFAANGDLRSAVRVLPASTSPTTGYDFDVPPAGALAGTIDPGGFTAGVGVVVCPGSVAITAGCRGQKSASVPAGGGPYRLPLGAGTYTAAAYTVVGTQFVLSPPQLVTVASSTDTAASFSLAGAAVTPSSSASVPTAEGDHGTLTLATSPGLVLSGVATAPLSTTVSPPPAGFQMETGLLAFTVTNVPASTRIPVTLHFDTDLGADLGYFKYVNGTWSPYADIERVDARTVRVWLTDNGTGDQDPTAGRIVDPGAIGRSVLEGFFRPVDMGGTVNVAKAGSTVPIKWYVPGTTDGALVRVESTSAGCAGSLTDVIEATSSGSGLQDLGGGYWQWNWRTSASFTGCRTLRVTFAGGQVRSASFLFR